MKNSISLFSAIALASTFVVLPTAPQAQAQDSIKEQLQFIKDQTGCRSDIAQFCSGIKVGSGKLYRCLDKNKARLTES